MSSTLSGTSFVQGLSKRVVTWSRRRLVSTAVQQDRDKSNMALKLYGSTQCPNTKRVRIMLEEMQVPYEFVILDMASGEARQPWYLQKHPFGQIPALEDTETGATAFESRAIMRYLGTKYDSELYGPDVPQRAAIDSWLEAEGQNFYKPAHDIINELIYNPMRGLPIDTAAVASHMMQVEQVLDVYENQLSARPYIAGRHFSAADISHMPLTASLMAAPTTAALFVDRPHLIAWWNRISARPSWAKVNK
eukprot:jgi/Chrzof1/9917/Cz04g20220.t1